jgi:hypothetical protein
MAGCGVPRIRHVVAGARPCLCFLVLGRKKEGRVRDGAAEQETMVFMRSPLAGRIYQVAAGKKPPIDVATATPVILTKSAVSNRTTQRVAVHINIIEPFAQNKTS